MDKFDAVLGNVDACDVSEGLGSFDCNVTFNKDITAYQELCAASNGTVFEDKMEYDCEVLLGASELRMHLNNLPVCLPRSCDLTTLSHDDINVAVLEDFKDGLRNGRCKVDGSAGVLFVPSVVKVMLVALVGLFAL